MNIRKTLWNIYSSFYPFYLRKVYGMDIGKDVIISYKANLDKSINPRGIHIGDFTWVLANSFILAHDHSRGIKTDTYIGSHCVIGISSIIMPGVKIGDHVVIGSGSVVTKDVESHCIVVGNPAKVVKEGIWINNKGQIVNHEERINLDNQII